MLSPSFLLLLASAGPGVVASAAALSQSTDYSGYESLYVDVAPSFLRPYVMPHYASAQGVMIGPQHYRFYVTGPSSDYAFTILATSAPQSKELGVLPHHHRRHYENFFSLKGRFQLFAEPKGSGEQQSRILTQHDYGAVVRNTTHSFKMLDPDTELVGFIVPGGFEDLFLGALGGENTTTVTHTPYVPTSGLDAAPAGPNAEGLALLEGYDVYSEVNFQPKTNTTIFPDNATWHTGPNALGEPGKPYFVANGWGPKYLNKQSGLQIIQPLVTSEQSQDTNFTLSFLSIDRQPTNVTVPQWNLPGSAAFQVLEGALSVKISGFPTAILTTGDVAFIPGNVSYTYWSDVAFTKTMYISSGFNGVDQALIKSGESWDYVVFPSIY